MTARTAAIARLPDLHRMREKRAHDALRECRRAVVEAEEAIRLCDVQLTLARDHRTTLSRWVESADPSERERFAAMAESRMQLLEQRCKDLGNRRDDYEATAEEARADLARAQKHWQQVRARADAVISLADHVKADDRRRRELRHDRQLSDELSAFGGQTR
ncbi:MAG: hypothetical protein WA979_12650 [Pacificimonas sp.]